MKRTYVSITLLMILGVGIIGASAYKSLYYDEKQEVTQKINLFLKQQNYMTYVKNKEIRYDTSTGEFFARVGFHVISDITLKVSLLVSLIVVLIARNKWKISF